MQQKPLYLTTTLPYVNADPHIGFALEIVHADIVARYNRSLGREVFFSTGTDEHGQKIFQKAHEQGQDVQAYVDHYAGQFEKLQKGLNLSYNKFIRTTDPAHVEAAQEIWRRCAQNVDEQGRPDIYKKKYKGLYCVGDEMFLKEGDLVDGKCPNHPNMEPVEIEEENWFFRLSRYETHVLQFLQNPDVILPDWRREEAIAFVKNGLEDFSISRETARMSWGIPVPGDESQVMYVWFDALTNYISTLGWPNEGGNFKKFWVEGETVQMAGKDQVRFQSIMWQAMLMSAKLPATSKVVYHGFITSGGQKMSKSLGNVIEPLSIVEEFGTDALRYYLARHISPFEDSDFTMQKFKEVYNADLSNGLGNLVRRVLTMARTYGVTLDALNKKTYKELILSNDIFYQTHARHLNGYDLQSALEIIWTRDDQNKGSSVIGWMDLIIQQEKPFQVIKTNPEKAKQVVLLLVRDLWHVATLIEPVMPETSKKILDAIEEKIDIPLLFPRKD